MSIDLSQFRKELTVLCEGESTQTESKRGRVEPEANGRIAPRCFKSVVKVDKTQDIAFKTRVTDNSVTVTINTSKVRSPKKLGLYLEDLKRMLSF